MDHSRRAGIGQWHEYDYVACNNSVYNPHSTLVRYVYVYKEHNMLSRYVNSLKSCDIFQITTL